MSARLVDTTPDFGASHYFAFYIVVSYGQDYEFAPFNFVVELAFLTQADVI